MDRKGNRRRRMKYIRPIRLHTRNETQEGGEMKSDILISRGK